MERLSEHGYMPMEHRELRFAFKAPRDIIDPDLVVASRQLARGDRQIFNEAKKLENEHRRVWFFLTFPCDSSTSKAGKSVVKVDVLIATAYGAMVLKVLDWSGPCETSPGDVWKEKRSDGTKVEHPNPLVELDRSMQWMRLFLESKGVCPATICSYILFSSPHAKPSFTSDPRIIVGPSACTSLVSGNGLQNELAETKSYMEWGQSVLRSAVGKAKGVAMKGVNSDQAPLQASSSSSVEHWRRFEACMEALPQFDYIHLRKAGCYIFGHMEKFEEVDGHKPGQMKILEKFCSRSSGRVFKFEHSVGGLASVPIALITGGLGWEPACRVRLEHGYNDISGTIDVRPQVRLHFRAYGCEGLVSAELNDIDILELAKVPCSMTIAEDGSDTGIVDHLGQLMGGMLTKTLQAGVKTMLPFPLNVLVN